MSCCCALIDNIFHLYTRILRSTVHNWVLHQCRFRALHVRTLNFNLHLLNLSFHYPVLLRLFSCSSSLSFALYLVFDFVVVVVVVALIWSFRTVVLTNCVLCKFFFCLFVFADNDEALLVLIILAQNTYPPNNEKRNNKHGKTFPLPLGWVPCGFVAVEL